MSEKIEKLITNIKNEIDKEDEWNSRTLDFLAALKHLDIDIRSNIHEIMDSLKENKDHEAVKSFMDKFQDWRENADGSSETDYFGYFQMMSCGYDDKFEKEGKL